MLYYWEGISDYYINENEDEYLEIILKLVCSIMHYKNDN